MIDRGTFLIADEADGADGQCEREDMLGALQTCIERLPEREQMVLQPYFFEELNLQEIGVTLDVSAACVCQIKRDAMASLEAMISAMTESAQGTRGRPAPPRRWPDRSEQTATTGGGGQCDPPSSS